MRVLVKYSRQGSACYISHLDMQRAFGRAFRRGKIATMYSEGFNPHIKMSFASPLSVGYATLGDYFEVILEDDEKIDEISQKLNNVLTNDIKIHKAVIIKDDVKKLMAMNHSAAYEIKFMWQNEGECDIIKRSVMDIDKVICEEKQYVTLNYKGKEIDIAPLIYEMKWEEDRLYARIANAEIALNPRVLADEIFKNSGLKMHYDVLRLNCFCSYKGNVLEFENLDKF